LTGYAPRILRRGPLVVLALALLCLLPAAVRAARPLRHLDRSQASTAVVHARQAFAGLAYRFGTPESLFREPDGTYAQAWPFSQAVAAAIDVAGLPGSGREAREVRTLVAGLEAYYDGTAYEAAVRAPYGPGGDQFFDDNEWLGQDLVAAAALLHDSSLLAQAQRIFGWVTSGWDGDGTHACPGGIHWVDGAGVDDRNAVSTANGALLALELYGATRNPSYLAWGKQLYDWVSGCLVDSDGLVFDHLDDGGHVNTAKWSYNQGAMIAAGALLYGATHDASYLRKAQSLAAASLARYGPSKFAGQPAIFVAIFFRDLGLLAQLRPASSYAAALARYVGSGAAAAPSSGSTVLDQAASVQLAVLAAR